MSTNSRRAQIYDDWKQGFCYALEAALDAELTMSEAEGELLEKLWMLATMCHMRGDLGLKKEVVVTADKLWRSASIPVRRSEDSWFRPEDKQYVPGLVPITWQTLVQYRAEIQELLQAKVGRLRHILLEVPVWYLASSDA